MFRLSSLIIRAVFPPLQHASACSPRGLWVLDLSFLSIWTEAGVRWSSHSPAGAPSLLLAPPRSQAGATSPDYLISARVDWGRYAAAANLVDSTV